jgi:hypothetical protein
MSGKVGPEVIVPGRTGFGKEDRPRRETKSKKCLMVKKKRKVFDIVCVDVERTGIEN